MGTLSTLAQLAKAANNITIDLDRRNSLTQYANSANIMSRLYIEDSILRDDICPPLVGVLNQLYVSYILSALNIDTMCADGRTVREKFDIVATENQNIVKDIMENFGSNKYRPSMEAGAVVETEPATQRLPVSRVIEITMNGISVLSEKEGKTTGDVNVDNKGNATIKPNNSSDKEVVVREKQSTYQFKAYLNVQLIPYVLKPEVVDGYISANFTPPTDMRVRQLVAGEISFWKDFVFCQDLLKKQRKILKKDKDNVISDMLNRQHGALFKWWRDFFDIFSGKKTQRSHNTANTILITNKITFDRACRENRINFADQCQRQKFFEKTWSMIVCVVDPLYNTVDMYFNGVNAKGTYTFAMINKVGAKGNDSFDLKEVMTAFSNGMSPKF